MHLRSYAPTLASYNAMMILISRDPSLLVVSRYYVVSQILYLNSCIYFELVSIYDERQRSGFIFLHVDIQIPQYTLSKILISLSPLLLLGVLPKIRVVYVLLVIVSVFMVMVTLWYVLISGGVMISDLFFVLFFNISLATQIFCCFLILQCFLSSIKNVIGVFLGIILNLKIILSSMN